MSETMENNGELQTLTEADLIALVLVSPPLPKGHALDFNSWGSVALEGDPVPMPDPWPEPGPTIHPAPPIFPTPFEVSHAEVWG